MEGEEEAVGGQHGGHDRVGGAVTSGERERIGRSCSWGSKTKIGSAPKIRAQIGGPLELFFYTQAPKI